MEKQKRFAFAIEKIQFLFFHILLLLIIIFKSYPSYCQNEVNTLLLKAVQSNDFIRVKSLVERGADVNTTDPNKASLLMWAAWNSNFEMVYYLVKKGADPARKGVIYVMNESGDTTGYLGSLVNIAATVDTGKGQLTAI